MVATTMAREAAEDLFFGQVVIIWSRWFIIAGAAILALQERLRTQAETLALRREIAEARRSAAEARYDAGESILGLSAGGDRVDALLEAAEAQALEAAARADAVEQMLAAWTHVADL